VEHVRQRLADHELERGDRTHDGDEQSERSDDHAPPDRPAPKGGERVFRDRFTSRRGRRRGDGGSDTFALTGCVRRGATDDRRRDGGSARTHPGARSHRVRDLLLGVEKRSLVDEVPEHRHDARDRRADDRAGDAQVGQGDRRAHSGQGARDDLGDVRPGRSRLDGARGVFGRRLGKSLGRSLRRSRWCGRADGEGLGRSHGTLVVRTGR
jgi:hypothetical protein